MRKKKLAEKSADHGKQQDGGLTNDEQTSEILFPYSGPDHDAERP